ncbi:unnamed protein product [Bursaphelenchus xylophilus]|uniref:(pine wood nematode) hypothetical protein n=1 Tax=Bursaphelenchus xylophilus TaxID=6326 RepID=A0A7I8XIT1_BURXY|nr:unnamed protein product [Bursaphelenchus xylophilus]CAG9125308.1 unnamed protein product [Bursaphelenchus xylophilus]
MVSTFWPAFKKLYCTIPVLHHQEVVITLFWGESGFDKSRSDTLGGLRSAYLVWLSQENMGMDFCGKTIFPKYVYVDGEFKENIAISTDEKGKITKIVPVSEAEHPIIELPELCILPGFVSAHSHAFQRELRGRSGIGAVGTQNFWRWRDDMYKLVEEADYDKMVKYTTKTFNEMLLAGITTVGEFHYVHHGTTPFDLDLAIIKAAKRTGIRLCLIETLYSRAGFKEHDVNDQQKRFKTSVDDLTAQVIKMGENLSESVTLAVAAHSLRAVPLDQLHRLHAFAVEKSIPFHIHIEEQPKEIQDCQSAHNCTPSELLLATLPGLDPCVTLVHCTYTDRKSLNEYARRGVNVCVTPTTEGFLGDGVPTLAEFDHISLGTDCNNRLCFLEEMRWLAFCQNTKTNTRNHAEFDAKKLIKCATENGARSLRLHEKVGQLQTGFFLDFVAFNLNSPRLKDIPASDLADAIVFGAGNSDIAIVVVGGVERGQF